VLGINGTPLMQMTVYAADGSVAAERGPLRVVTLEADVGTPVQVLVTNEGVASGLLTLSCRADLPTPNPAPKAVSKPLPRVDLNPIADPATGAQGPVESLPEPPGPKPADVKEEVSQEPSAQEQAVQEPSAEPEGLRGQ
jgi:serine/threonine-protein kinase